QAGRPQLGHDLGGARSELGSEPDAAVEVEHDSGNAAGPVPTDGSQRLTHRMASRTLAETHSAITTSTSISTNIVVTCAHCRLSLLASSCRPLPPAPTRPTTVDSRMLMSQR